MWEFVTSTSRGVTLRSIFLSGLAVLLTAFFATAITAQTSYAAEAVWSGNNIEYDGDVYTGPLSEDVVKALDFPEQTTAYSYSATPSTTPREVQVIYFAPGAEPSERTSANYRTYTFVGLNTYNDATTPEIIALIPSATSNPGTSSCDIEGGLGWIICPTTNLLAGFMDGLYGIMAELLEVRPITLDTENAMYRAWSIMRSIANVAFVIAFLVIIYSQLTSVGLNNYSLKKLLPRLIIAAILVNISYIICALAIDISNLLGFSIQNLFIDIRNTLVGSEGNGWSVISFESVATFVLAGGAGAAAGGVALFSTLGTFGVVGTLALLIPVLVGGFISILVSLLIIAARQALITILTVIAPLAFVAYLLPNTEDWFKKWRSLFMTMLIFFPAFSVVFGGSALAGALILQNANSINIIILGLAVQVAPLFITPLLLKLSGALLSRFVGIMNNPNKGIIDRTRKWSGERAEQLRAKRMATEAKPWQIMKRAGQRMDHDRRRRDGYKNAYNSLADGYFTQTESGQGIAHINHQAHFEKDEGESRANEHWAHHVQSDPYMRQRRVDQIGRQGRADLYKSEVEAAGKEQFERSVQQDVRPGGLRDIKVAQIGAEGRAKVYADNVTAQGNQALQAQIEADRTIGGLSDISEQTAIAEGVAQIHKTRIDARGKLAFRDTVMADRALRLAEVDTFELQKRAELSESVIKAKSEANWNNIKFTDSTVKSMQLEQIKISTAAKKAEEQWSSLVKEVIAKGSTASGIAASDATMADAIKNLQVDIETESNRQGAFNEQHQQNIAKVFERDDVIRMRAGGDTAAGAQAVLAKAKQNIIKAFSDAVSAEQQIHSRTDSEDLKIMMDDPNISSEQLAAYTGLIAKRGYHADHNRLLYKLSTMYEEAEAANARGDAGAAERLDMIRDAQQQAISDMSKMPFGVSDSDRKDLSQGQYRSNVYEQERARIMSHISPESMSTMDPDDLNMLYELDRIGALSDVQRQKIIDTYDAWEADDILGPRLQNKHKNILERIKNPSIPERDELFEGVPAPNTSTYGLAMRGGRIIQN